MPNGHGGYFRFGGALMLGIALALLYVWYRKLGAPWLGWAGYPLAAAFGWRFAFGLHMWKVTEYDGAYTGEEAWMKAFVKYIAGSVVYAAGAVVAWYFLT